MTGQTIEQNIDDYNKETTLYMGDLKSFDCDTQRKLRQELLFFIKEKGLTVSQAQELLVSVAKELPDYSVILSVADYEKLTGTTFCQ